MLKKSKKIIIILATCCSALAFGQIAPINSRTTFKTPYSARVSEWPEKITLTLFLRDLNVTKGRVFVRMRIESATVSLETLPLYGSQAFQLDGGVPIQIDGSELRVLFRPENLVFSGITREDFIRNGSRLPEGRYKLWFEVYEWGSRLKVSASESFVTINLHDIEPPILNFPKNNSLVTAQTPQNIVFSWTPRHFPAISSGFRGVYDFELMQIPLHYHGDLNILFETTSKYAEKRLFQTQFRYSQFDEALAINQRYAFRVRVRSIDDNDESFQFKNNGYSEIFTFLYTEKCEKPKNLQGFPENPYTANLSWEGDNFKNRFLVSYRKMGSDEFSWFTKTTEFSSLLLNDLSPGQTYEIKVRTLCEFTSSEDSDSIFITTPALSDSNLRSGIIFVPVDTCVNSFIKFNVEFENIRINECFQHTEGIINKVQKKFNRQNIFIPLQYLYSHFYYQSKRNTIDKPSP